MTQYLQYTNDYIDHGENDDVPVDNIYKRTQLISVSAFLCDLHDYDHDAPGEMKYCL